MNRKEWIDKQVKKIFHPNWEEMMKVLGHPKQEAVFTNRSIDPSDMDGAWDFAAAQKGLGMRRVAADIGKSTTDIETPTGFVFICQCGYARRVIDSEHAFSCERQNASGEKGCGVIWEVELEESDDVDPKTGTFKKKPVYQERMSIGKVQRKYMMPKIKGRLVADMRRETAMARKAAGTASASEMQPQTFGDKQPKVQVAEPIVVPEPPTPSVGGDR